MKYPPLPVRDAGPEAEKKWAEPQEGISPWLRPSLLAWLKSAMELMTVNSREVDDRVLALQRRARLPLDEDLLRRNSVHALENCVVRNPDHFLAAVDCSVQMIAPMASSLKAALQEAGSVFTVELDGEGTNYLARRISPVVAELVQRAAAADDRAGHHLRDSWRLVYGRETEPSGAFREAIRAVEAVACPVVCPNNDKATLGTVIADLRSGPSKFALVLEPNDGSSAIERARHMCELLWKSQLDRHGTGDPEAPLNVSLEEAETALHLAATLVHWFATKKLRRA